MANEKIETYEEAARVISLYLKEFCDESLTYPEMIAEASRRANKKINEQSQLIEKLKQETIYSKLAAVQVDKLILRNEQFQYQLEAKSDMCDKLQSIEEDYYKYVCKTIIKDNPEKVEEFKAFKPELLGYFVGEAMKATKGKANPKMLNSTMKELLIQYNQIK